MYPTMWFELTGEFILECIPLVSTVTVSSPIGFVNCTKKEANRLLVWRQKSVYLVEYNGQADYLAIHELKQTPRLYPRTHINP